MLQNNQNDHDPLLNCKQRNSETATDDDIRYQIELLNDIARTDINRAFSFALLKVEHLEKMIVLYREIITEEKKWLAMNDTAFEKIVEICKVAQLDEARVLAPGEIIGIIKGRIADNALCQ